MLDKTTDNYRIMEKDHTCTRLIMFKTNGVLLSMQEARDFFKAAMTLVRILKTFISDAVPANKSVAFENAHSRLL